MFFTPSLQFLLFLFHIVFSLSYLSSPLLFSFSSSSFLLPLSPLFLLPLRLASPLYLLSILSLPSLSHPCFSSNFCPQSSVFSLPFCPFPLSLCPLMSCPFCFASLSFLSSLSLPLSLCPSLIPSRKRCAPAPRDACTPWGAPAQVEAT